METKAAHEPSSSKGSCLVTGNNKQACLAGGTPGGGGHLHIYASGKIKIFGKFPDSLAMAKGKPLSDCSSFRFSFILVHGLDDSDFVRFNNQLIVGITGYPIR